MNDECEHNDCTAVNCWCKCHYSEADWKEANAIEAYELENGK